MLFANCYLPLHPPITLVPFSRYIATTRVNRGPNRIFDALRSALQVRYNQTLPLNTVRTDTH
jgi:hypothetical protein